MPEKGIIMKLIKARLLALLFNWKIYQKLFLEGK